MLQKWCLISKIGFQREQRYKTLYLLLEKKKKKKSFPLSLL